MKQCVQYDYIIIGAGIAGFQLALEFSKDSFFSSKRIALIDKSHKTINNKTLSFWEKGEGKWDSIVVKSWNEASIYTRNKNLSLKLNPYNYKTIRALDFYNKIKIELLNLTNFTFITEEVLSIENKTKLKVKTKQNSYETKHVFDSRIPKEYYLKSNNHIKIKQHFKGWVIKTDSHVFDTNKFTMMDYRMKDGEQTTFTYVLPFSKNKALIEFTYFTKNLVEQNTYDQFIENYISDHLKIKNYEIIETETGIIPMTNFPFEKYSEKNITKIGTAGGWVKGSTGYSFKHTEKKVASIIFNIKNGLDYSKFLFIKKYKFYDKIFLKVLNDENGKGEWIFEQLYSKNSIRTILKFLDEETSVLEELKIMKSLFSFAFIKAFFKTLKS